MISRNPKIFPYLSPRLEILLNGHYQKLRYLQEAMEEVILDLKGIDSQDLFWSKLESIRNRVNELIISYQVALKIYNELFCTKRKFENAIRENINIKCVQNRSSWIEERLGKLLQRRDRAGARLRRDKNYQPKPSKCLANTSNEFNRNVMGDYIGSTKRSNLPHWHSLNNLLYSEKYYDKKFDDTVITATEQDITFMRNQLSSSQMTLESSPNLNILKPSSLISQINISGSISSISNQNSLNNSLTNSNSSIMAILLPTENCSIDNDFAGVSRASSVDKTIHIQDMDSVISNNLITPNDLDKEDCHSTISTNLRCYDELYIQKQQKERKNFQEINCSGISHYTENENPHYIKLSNLRRRYLNHTLDNCTFVKPHCAIYSTFMATRSTFLNDHLYPKIAYSSVLQTCAPIISQNDTNVTKLVSSKSTSFYPSCSNNKIKIMHSKIRQNSLTEFKSEIKDKFIITYLQELASPVTTSNSLIAILSLLHKMPNYIPSFIIPIFNLFRYNSDLRVRYEAMKILLSLCQVHDEILLFSLGVFELDNWTIHLDLLQSFRLYLPIFNVKSSSILESFKIHLSKFSNASCDGIIIESLLLLTYYFPSLASKEVLLTVFLSNTFKDYCVILCTYFVKHMDLNEEIIIFILSRLLSDSEHDRLEVAKLLCSIQPNDWSLTSRHYCYSLLSRLLWEDPSRFVREQIKQTIFNIGMLSDIISEITSKLDDNNDLIRLRAIKSLGSLQETSPNSIQRLLEILEIDSSTTVKLQAIKTLSIISKYEPKLQSVIIEKSKGEGYIALEAQKIMKSSLYNLTNVNIQ
ncbi:hypothetical protein LOD99_10749 [Oopsacas minuta]|uniref:Uncharacterized protein n=1 Tax=Oopsacas minuta TaxID=111878 RepID=A0AAV7KGS2_9METZ|nr:hypothetical protein LOD99_10749 [Oopsacas minuta]